MTKIVLLQDVYAIKEQKERELAYYREQLEIIHEKLVWIEREYKLTKDIIKMIEQETIVSIK
jgi:5-bromo-4-chloroindolyl phosphate hydrolysis protein